MLQEYLEKGFGLEEDLSCSETILYGANDVWTLGLDKNALKMAAGLSAGVYSGNICGALTAGAMVLSRIYIKERAHNSPENRALVKEFIDEYRKKMGSELCGPLKEKHRTEEDRCRPVILAAASVLDRLIEREGIPQGE